jgi:hypothetical protein
MEVANAAAHYNMAKITTGISIIVHAPGLVSESSLQQ